MYLPPYLLSFLPAFLLLAEYSKDLPSYLQYCKDVVFAGVEPSFEDIEESKIIEEFWDIYQKQQVRLAS